VAGGSTREGKVMPRAVSLSSAALRVECSATTPLASLVERPRAALTAPAPAAAPPRHPLHPLLNKRRLTRAHRQLWYEMAAFDGRPLD
jgi:hypothetical protein